MEEEEKGKMDPSSSSLTTTTIPNESILAAVEKLGYTVSVPAVIKETGLETDVVEAELALLLRLSRGFFEVTTSTNPEGEEHLPGRW